MNLYAADPCRWIFYLLTAFLKLAHMVVGGEAVDIIRTGMFVLAILWVLSQLVVTRRKLRTGQVVILPLFAATLVFLVCILVVAALGASPLHLLWLFLLSFVLGLALLLFPPGVKLTMACLELVRK